MPYMQPWVILTIKTWKINGDYYALYATRGYCPCEDMKNKIGVILPYMQPGVTVPYEDMKIK